MALGAGVDTGDPEAIGVGVAVDEVVGAGEPVGDDTAVAEGVGVAVATAGTLAGRPPAVAARTPAPTPAIAASPNAEKRTGRPGRRPRVAICFGRVATCPLELTPAACASALRRAAAG